jgi:hypothetical protein
LIFADWQVFSSIVVNRLLIRAFSEAETPVEPQTAMLTVAQTRMLRVINVWRIAFS